MNERDTIRSVAELLAAQTGLDNDYIEKFIETLCQIILQGVKQDHVVRINGLGVFKIQLVRKRESVHIKTGERFVIPAHHKIAYTPDKELKELINRPFSFLSPIETDDYVTSGGVVEETPSIVFRGISESVQLYEEKKPMQQPSTHLHKELETMVPIVSIT